MALTAEFDNVFYQDQDAFLGLVDKAIKGRYMTLFNFLLDTRSAKDNVNWMCGSAVQYNQLDILKLIYERFQTLDDTPTYLAAEKNNLEMLKWLYEHGSVLDTDTFSCAVYKGSIEMLQWLYDNKCPWNKEIYSNAIMRQSIDVVQWMNDHNMRGDVDDIRYMGFKKDKLKFIIDNKHLFNECIVDYARLT